MKILYLCFLFLLAIKPSFAKLDFEDHAFPEFVTSARALAMGNAYLNKVDDSWSAFYNPAGLGTVRQPQLHLANVHVEASSTMMTVLKEEGTDSLDQNIVRTQLAEEKGKLAHSRFNLFPNFTVRGLTLGYLFSQRNRAIINDDVANKFEVAERRDQGPVMSLTASLFGGVFKFGATGIYLNRRDLYKSFGPTEPTNLDGVDYKRGKSLQVIAGARLTFPVTLLPTFSAVLRNATDNGWEDVKGGGEPDLILQTVDYGFSITPQISKISRIHMEVNLKDANNKYDISYKRRLAVGMELDFQRRFFLRGGYGDGWGSGGIGYRNKMFIMDLTTYAVDRSQDGFREEEDRRYVFSFATGF